MKTGKLSQLKQEVLEVKLPDLTKFGTFKFFLDITNAMKDFLTIEMIL